MARFAFAEVAKTPTEFCVAPVELMVTSRSRALVFVKKPTPKSEPGAVLVTDSCRSSALAAPMTADAVVVMDVFPRDATMNVAVSPDPSMSTKVFIVNAVAPMS